MDRLRRTTVRFPRRLCDRLRVVAKFRGVSLGQLVREACEEKYAAPTKEERLAAVRELCAMNLPVGDPETLERESVPQPENLSP